MYLEEEGEDRWKQTRPTYGTALTLALSETQMTDFLPLSYTLTDKIPTLLYT